MKIFAIKIIYLDGYIYYPHVTFKDKNDAIKYAEKYLSGTDVDHIHSYTIEEFLLINGDH